jgi:DNA invertase Pin-like site-specific DNA recombinase
LISRFEIGFTQGIFIMAVYAYKRCSTSEEKQDVSRQLLGMTFDKVFIEYASGKNEEGRPVFLEMKSILKKGDEVWFNDLSRCGRNTRLLLTTVEDLVERGVKVVFKSENLTFVSGDVAPMEGAASKIMLTFLAGVNELFLTQNKIAITQGIENARQKGVKFGAANPKYNRTKHISKRTRSDAKQYWEQHRQQVESVVKMMKSNKIKLTYENICSNFKTIGITSREGKEITPTQTKRVMEILNISR